MRTVGVLVLYLHLFFYRLYVPFSTKHAVSVFNLMCIILFELLFNIWQERIALTSTINKPVSKQIWSPGACQEDNWAQIETLLKLEINCNMSPWIVTV